MQTKNAIVALAVSVLMLNVMGCNSHEGKSVSGRYVKLGVDEGADNKDSGADGRSADGNGADGGASTSESSNDSEPTQAFHASFDGIDLVCYVGGQPDNSYLEFKEGDKVLIKEKIAYNSQPKILYGEKDEGEEHLPLHLASKDGSRGWKSVNAIVISLVKDEKPETRIYEIKDAEAEAASEKPRVSLLTTMATDASLTAVSGADKAPGGKPLYELEALVEYKFAGARRVAPSVTLCLQSGKLVFDQVAMRAQAPNAEKLDGLIGGAKIAFAEKDEIKALIKAQAERKKLKVSGSDFDLNGAGDDPLAVVPQELGDNILECVYAGRLDLGLKVLDKSWPPKLRGKKKYWRALQAEMEKSPYWAQLQLLNKGR